MTKELAQNLVVFQVGGKKKRKVDMFPIFGVESRGLEPAGIHRTRTLGEKSKPPSD